MKSGFFPTGNPQEPFLFRVKKAQLATAKASAGTSTGHGGQRQLFLLLLLAVAAALSFYRLGAKDLWLDEAISIYIARLDWARMWKLMSTKDPNMGLYYVLLHFWLRQFGTAEFAVRSLSAILAVASLIPVYAIGGRLFGRNTGFLAALLLTVNAFLIHYAQETRSYALFLLLAATASYLFLRALDSSSAKTWVLYSLVAALCVYAHFFAVWMIAAHFVSAIAFRSGRVLRREFIGSHVLIACLASPLLVPILIPGMYSLQLGWLAKPSLASLADFFLVLTGYGGLLLICIYAAALAYGLFSTWTQRSRDRFKTWAYAFLFTWLFLPVTASFLFSIILKPIFVPRYLITSLPPLVLITAAGLQNLRPAWWKLAVVLLLLALSSQSLMDWYAEGGKFKREAWRAATSYLLANSRGTDGVMFEQGFSRIPFEYYLQELHPQTILAKPVWPSAPWGKFDKTNWGPWPSIKQQDYRRLWRVLLYEPASVTDSRWLPRNSNGEYCLMHRQSFPFIQVILYQTCP